MDPRFATINQLVGFPLVQNISIMAVGLGRVGSAVLDQLVRAGFELFSVWDADSLEIQQLVTGCFMGKPGEPKVKCVQRHLSMLNPNIKFRGFVQAITAQNTHQFIQEVTRHHLLLALFDDFDLLNPFLRAVYPICPVVGGRLFRNAFSADAYYSYPGSTSCGACCIGEGNQQIRRGQGLAVDIFTLAQVITRIVLAIVHSNTPYFPNYQSYLRPNHNYFLIANRPDETLSPDTFIPAQVRLVEVQTRCETCRQVT
jgi:hypothetical protein